MGKVYIFDHPLIQHKLSLMRDVHTGAKEFRELLEEISMLMVYEVTRDLPTKEVEIETPLCKTKARHLSGKKVGIVPILRAGLGMVDGVAKLVHNHQVKHVIATHVGMTPDVGTQGMVDKTLTVDLIPQGSLAEMIRAGGAGLGGVLTPTGVGTIVEDSPFCLGKQTIDGKEYLLMKPLHADFALVNAYNCLLYTSPSPRDTR